MRASLSTPKTFSSLITRSLPRAISTSSTRSIATTRPLTSLSNPRPQPRRLLPKPCFYQAIRTNSSKPSQGIDFRPLTDRLAHDEEEARHAEQNRIRREQEPAYQVVFTCKPCGQRSAHRMSKQGYHKGTVVIRCPSCSNRHVMSDHLKIFFDKSSTLDDILSERGAKVTKGYLDGDFEFWEDGTVTKSETAGQAEKKSDDDAQGKLP